MGAYKHLNNCAVNLAQAKELSLRRHGLSLKRKVFALARLKTESTSSSRSS